MNLNIAFTNFNLENGLFPIVTDTVSVWQNSEKSTWITYFSDSTIDDTKIGICVSVVSSWDILGFSTNSESEFELEFLESKMFTLLHFVFLVVLLACV